MGNPFPGTGVAVAHGTRGRSPVFGVKKGPRVGRTRRGVSFVSSEGITFIVGPGVGVSGSGVSGNKIGRGVSMRGGRVGLGRGVRVGVGSGV